LTRSIRVAYALGRAASAFVSTLVRHPPAAPRRTLSSELRSAGVENRCPVCQARFRGARICSRCGADLEPLMLLTVKAWQLREAARQALGAGEVERALGLAIEAQGVQGTGNGEALRLLGAWLAPK
jgi:predicted amidophosphoribosyltransferase